MNGAVRRTPRVPNLLVLAVLAVLPALVSDIAVAQGGRGSVSSTVRYLELRPLSQDTVPLADVTALPDGRFRYDGRPAACEETMCVVFGMGDVQHALLATHDADATFWGFGVQGLSATVQLRARTHLDGELRLPYADETLEAILAYAELVRGMVRVRAGRQRELSGLGFAGFDGVGVMVEPSRSVRAQLYGGRSLARSVQQPIARAFRGVDEQDFIRDRDAYLLGGEVAWESSAGSMLALRYQGEIWDDRGGLLSERALLIGRTSAIRPVEVAGSAEYDAGLGRIGKAHLEVQYAVPRSTIRVEAAVRRHLPFFEYWTIWGLFSPVAHHEAELRTSWSPRPPLAVWGSAAYRRYAPHGTQTFLDPLSDETIRLGAGGAWRIADDLAFDGAVRLEGPVGAFSFTGDAAVQWRARPRLDLSMHALLLEQVEEFRAGAATVMGGGIGADMRVSSGVSAAAGLELYRQGQHDRPGGVNWTQRRGWVSLRFDLGRDPGLQREDDR